MRVLIVTNHFWPENFRINDLALGLRARGHEITVYTGVPDYPEGRFYPGYGVWRRHAEEYEGIKVRRFPLIPRGKGRGRNLLLNYVSSCLMACLLVPLYCRDRYDVIFVFDTSPVTIGIPAIVMQQLRSIPMLFWVLDLWPESLAATGAIRSERLLGAVRRVVRFIYRRCDRILVSSRGFFENIKKVGGYTGEIEYFPNWVEPEYVEALPARDGDELPALPDGFRVMFAGNIGAAQDFETILRAAELIAENGDIHWVILGDGRRFEWVRKEVQRRGLGDQFHLLGCFPPEAMSRFFGEADVMLVTLKREPIFSLTIPGKVQSYMASGKPIIAALDGEGARLVDEAHCGLNCPAESPGQLAQCVLAMYRMSAGERDGMGSNALTYAQEHFDREKLFDRVERIMLEVTRASSS
ncbi:MAG TPA: glycosyltransferase WbuB [Candidatus Acetothermia bacterium]|nr:glycosyltransferase WbuB [Candidatus Acetothermia bacterium]